MSNRKQPVKTTGLFPKLKQFINALGDRYQRALHVIDEALVSDNLKDKIWAVETILKRTPAAALDEDGGKKSVSQKKKDSFSANELEKLSEAELLSRIRGYLKETDL